MNESWIKLFRKLRDWEWYKDSNTKDLFIEILLTANYEDKDWHGIKVTRGQLISSIGNLGGNIGLSFQQTRTSLNKLKSTSEITIKTTNKFTIITVNKYEDYQETTNKITTKNPENNKQTNNQATTTKEYKEIKNNKNRALPLFSSSQKPKKGLGDLTDAMAASLERIKNAKPARNVPEWMAHALEVSDKLKIDWNHPELVKEKIKPRWFSLFKQKPWGQLQSAYSFCYDYPNRPDSAGMVKLFFWRVGGGGRE